MTSTFKETDHPGSNQNFDSRDDLQARTLNAERLGSTNDDGRGSREHAPTGNDPATAISRDATRRPSELEGAKLSSNPIRRG